MDGSTSLAGRPLDCVDDLEGGIDGHVVLDEQVESRVGGAEDELGDLDGSESALECGGDAVAESRESEVGVLDWILVSVKFTAVLM